jgi:hypothetical protein
MFRAAPVVPILRHSGTLCSHAPAGMEKPGEMVDESRHRGGAGRALRLSCWALVCSGCAQVLGIPTDPQLVPAAVAPPRVVDAGASGGSSGVTMEPIARPDAGSVQSNAGAGSVRDGVGPVDVGGIVAPVDAAVSPVAGPANQIDAGFVPVADAGRPPPACVGAPGRAPIDVIFAVDNSGSMAEECTSFEQALPGFVERLSSAGVDYRIILVSRHRRDDRESGSEASTSVCVAAPVSGLAACPSESPVLAARFFHHSIKLDAADSFQRLLESFGEPDPFGLNATGWSEWLRPAARKIFIEITDADSDLSASDFTSALQAASPEQFGVDAPSFVFHAVVGIAAKATDGGVYGPAEPIELEACSGPGSSIDGVGVAYQELSRTTGGLRLSICPPAALGSSLEALADDAIARSEPACPG